MVTQHCQCANVYSVLGLYTLTYTVYNEYSVLELYALKYLQWQIVCLCFLPQ